LFLLFPASVGPALSNTSDLPRQPVESFPQSLVLALQYRDIMRKAIVLGLEFAREEAALAPLLLQHRFQAFDPLFVATDTQPGSLSFELEDA
ncbi:hypothetical protein KCU89_g16036, partial [Aureobasidium melanogenum]